MKVFVTGGSGFIGFYLIHALKKDGHEIILLLRHDREIPKWCDGCKIIRADITDEEAIYNGLNGCDAVIHMAAWVKMWGKRDEAIRTTVKGTYSVVASAKKAKIPRRIYVSTLFALGPTKDEPLTEDSNSDGDYRTLYEETKTIADMLVRDEAKRDPWVLLYPGVVFGIGPQTEGNSLLRFTKDILGGRMPFIIGGGKNMISVVWGWDIACGIVSALKKGRIGERYLLGGENIRLKDLLALIASGIGKKSPSIPIPLYVAEFIGYLEEKRAKLFKTTPFITSGAVKTMASGWQMDSSKAKKELEYKITPISKIIPPFAKWVMAGCPAINELNL